MKSRLFLPPQYATSELQKSRDHLMRKIDKTKNKILDDFSKAYLASTGLKPEEVVLVQQNNETDVRFFFARRPKYYPIESKLMVNAKTLLDMRDKFSSDDAKAEDGRAYMKAFIQLAQTISEIEEEHTRAREASKGMSDEQGIDTQEHGQEGEGMGGGDDGRKTLPEENI